MLFEYLIYHLFAFRNKCVFITNDAAYYYDTMIHGVHGWHGAYLCMI